MKKLTTLVLLLALAGCATVDPIPVPCQPVEIETFRKLVILPVTERPSSQTAMVPRGAGWQFWLSAMAEDVLAYREWGELNERTLLEYNAKAAELNAADGNIQP